MKYEYSLSTCGTADVHYVLKEAGLGGWELVSVIFLDPMTREFYFKRQINDTKENKA